MAVDTAYYDLLLVSPTATPLEIKKSYRKLAVKHHPDKNPDDPKASERFQEIGEAYQVLSDPELRKRYDQYGKDQAVPSAGFEDPVEFFSMIFGGSAFKDLIGELSFLKELTRTAELSEINQDKTESTSENSNNSNDSNDSPSNSHQSNTNTNINSSSNLLLEHGSSTTDANQVDKSKENNKNKNGLTPEQEEKIAKYEEETRLARKERIETLSSNLISKVSLYTETDKQKDVIYSFKSKIKIESESLKMESFGLEILHTIGKIYISKGETLIKKQKFLGIPGFFSALKEKGTLVADTFKTISSAMDAQASLQQIAKIQEDNLTKQQRKEEKEQAKSSESSESSESSKSSKSTEKDKSTNNTIDTKENDKKVEEDDDDILSPEELANLERTMIGKVLSAAWHASKYEIQGVLREVCDTILYDPKTPLVKRLERANALIIMGEIFIKAERTEEEDEEARVFEELVAEATTKQAKNHTKKEKEELSTKEVPTTSTST